MNGSENLWSDDELLDQMETMQSQIENLLTENEKLKGKCDALRAERDEQRSKAQKHSSENSKLRSWVPIAEKKIQEQSERIVSLNESDLILQENERLRRGIAEAEEMTSTVKAECEKRNQELDEKEDRLSAMLRNEQTLIEDRARELFTQVIGEAKREHQEQLTVLRKRMRYAIGYGIIVTVLAVVFLVI